MFVKMKKRTIIILGICILISLVLIVIAEDSLTSYEYITKTCESSKSIIEYKECMRLCISKEPVYITTEYIKQIPVYKNESLEVCCTSKESCGDCKSLEIVENQSCSFGCKEIDIQVIDYYTNETYEREVLVGYECRTGIIIDDKVISNPNVNVKDNKVIEWNYPIGDRNFEEFGECREYERLKGMCKETSILELVK